MPQPVVRAFGPLRLEVDGHELGPTDLGGRKPMLILEILLLAPIPRDRLAELLWDRDRPRKAASIRPGHRIASVRSRAEREADGCPGSDGADVADPCPWLRRFSPRSC